MAFLPPDQAYERAISEYVFVGGLSVSVTYSGIPPSTYEVLGFDLGYFDSSACRLQALGPTPNQFTNSHIFPIKVGSISLNLLFCLAVFF